MICDLAIRRRRTASQTATGQILGAMYFFYVDETGNLDTNLAPQADGSPSKKDWLYVLTAVAVFEWQWREFDGTITAKKRDMIARLPTRGGPRLELHDCEVKSTRLRNPHERADSQFFSNLYAPEIEELVGVFYDQLVARKATILSVVIDKRKLHDYMDQGKLHRKAWELLLERIEFFLRTEHTKHNGVIITDDVSVQANRALAMKYAFLREQGTSGGCRLRHLVEMPLFVRSELSNGVQLADLVSYNIYRAYKYGAVDYPWFKRIRAFIWRLGEAENAGLKVFPPDSDLVSLRP